jgi:hypothetical protein
MEGLQESHGGSPRITWKGSENHMEGLQKSHGRAPRITWKGSQNHMKGLPESHGRAPRITWEGSTHRVVHAAVDCFPDGVQNLLQRVCGLLSNRPCTSIAMAHQPFTAVRSCTATVHISLDDRYCTSPALKCLSECLLHLPNPKVSL